MEYLILVDGQVGELEKIITGKKNMIVRSYRGKGNPYCHIEEGDIFYFINPSHLELKWKGKIKSLSIAKELNKKQAQTAIMDNQSKLNLSLKEARQWGRKRNLVFFELSDIVTIPEIIFPSLNHRSSWIPFKRAQYPHWFLS